MTAGETPRTGALITGFLNSVRASGKSDAYVGIIEYNLSFLEKRHPDRLPETVEELEALFVEAYHNKSESVRFDIFRRTRLLYRWASARYEIHNPFLDTDREGRPLLAPPPVRRQAPTGKALTEEELFRLLRANMHLPRVLAAILLIYDAGLRPGEAYNMRFTDLQPGHVKPDGEFELGRIRVHGKTGEKVIAVLPQVEQALSALQPGEVLWANRKTGKPLARDSFDRMIERAFKRAGLKGSGYRLRHTAATIAALRGADSRYIKSLLGHADTRMAEHYVEESAALRAEQHRKYSALSDWKAAFQLRLQVVEKEAS